MRISDEYSSPISPKDFEIQVKGIIEQFDTQISNYEIIHNDKISTTEGDYQIDIKVTFDLLGVKFIVLIECKRFNSSIKRDTVQILKDKVIVLGAQKGLLVSTSGFQKGAIKYAKKHGIALVRIIQGDLTYETKSSFKNTYIPDCVDIPEYVFYWIQEIAKQTSSYTVLNSDYIKNFENIILPGK